MSGINPSGWSRLELVDFLCDWTPGVSTATNFAELVTKFFYRGKNPSNDALLGERTVKHIKDKSKLRCAVLLVPVAGQAALGTYKIGEWLVGLVRGSSAPSVDGGASVGIAEEDLAADDAALSGTASRGEASPLASGSATEGTGSASLSEEATATAAAAAAAAAVVTTPAAVDNPTSWLETAVPAQTPTTTELDTMRDYVSGVDIPEFYKPGPAYSKDGTALEFNMVRRPGHAKSMYQFRLIFEHPTSENPKGEYRLFMHPKPKDVFYFGFSPDKLKREAKPGELEPFSRIVYSCIEQYEHPERYE